MSCEIIQYQGRASALALRDKLVSREDAGGTGVEARVREMLNAVKNRGDQALVEYCRKFDCPDFDEAILRVPAEEIAAARELVPASDIAILEEAAGNIRRFHEGQIERSWWTTDQDGAVLGQLVRPLDSAGLYVPGGKGGETPLVSSLLMNAIPAQVAGVARIAVTSPPRKDGTLNPYILAAASILGLSEIYRAGGAWAVAALAYGTQSIKAVDFIAGPGNIYVTTAKRLLIGRVGIDMIAGPSEIVILAESGANPAWLAADMLSQAEHDPLASAVLVTPCRELAAKVQAELARQSKLLPRFEIAEKSLSDWGAFVLVKDLSEALEVVNVLAPEHLELAVDDPWSLLHGIRNAGAIFMGQCCPEPVGDYFAGPNHVLPTLSTARFSQALSVQAFTKKSSLIATPSAYVARHGAKIARLARLEALEAHARSVECRIKE